MNQRRRWPLGAVAAFLAIACSDTTGPGVSTLAGARWTAAGPSHYQYVYDLSCECVVTGPVRLNVENGIVTGFALLPGSNVAGGAPQPSDFPTIDDLFAHLRAEIADDEYTFRVTDLVALEPLTE